MPSTRLLFASSPRRQKDGKKKGCRLKTPVQFALAASQPSSCLSIALEPDYREIEKDIRLASGVALYHLDFIPYGRELTRYLTMRLLATDRALWRCPDMPYNRPWRTTCGFTGWPSLTSFDIFQSEATCSVSHNRQCLKCIGGGADRYPPVMEGAPAAPMDGGPGTLQSCCLSRSSGVLGKPRVRFHTLCKSPRRYSTLFLMLLVNPCFDSHSTRIDIFYRTLGVLRPIQRI